MDLKTFERLSYLAKHMSSSEVGEFENILVPYVGKQDPETLQQLLKIFDDKCPFPEVMYSLVHLVESWPHEVYVRCVLRSVPYMLVHSFSWLEGIVYGIFNHPQCLELFKQNMHLAPPGALLKLFDKMEKESPHHRALITELRKELRR